MRYVITALLAFALLSGAAHSKSRLNKVPMSHPFAKKMTNCKRSTMGLKTSDQIQAIIRKCKSHFAGALVNIDPEFDDALKEAAEEAARNCIRWIESSNSSVGLEVFIDQAGKKCFRHVDPLLGN